MGHGTKAPSQDWARLKSQPHLTPPDTFPGGALGAPSPQRIITGIWFTNTILLESARTKECGLRPGIWRVKEPGVGPRAQTPRAGSCWGGFAVPRGCDDGVQLLDPPHWDAREQVFLQGPRDRARTRTHGWSQGLGWASVCRLPGHLACLCL